MGFWGRSATAAGAWWCSHSTDASVLTKGMWWSGSSKFAWLQATRREDTRGQHASQIKYFFFFFLLHDWHLKERSNLHYKYHSNFTCARAKSEHPNIRACGPKRRPRLTTCIPLSLLSLQACSLQAHRRASSGLNKVNQSDLDRCHRRHRRHCHPLYPGSTIFQCPPGSSLWFLARWR